jgi:hypothetical protein
MVDWDNIGTLSKATLSKTGKRKALGAPTESSNGVMLDGERVYTSFSFLQVENFGNSAKASV